MIWHLGMTAMAFGLASQARPKLSALMPRIDAILFVRTWPPAYTGSNPACHKARGDANTDWTQTPRVQHIVKTYYIKLEGLIWVSNHTLVTNRHASINIGSLYLMWKNNRSTRRRTTAGLLGLQIELIHTWFRS